MRSCVEASAFTERDRIFLLMVRFVYGDHRRTHIAGDDRREVVSLLAHIAVVSHLFIPSSATYGQVN